MRTDPQILFLSHGGGPLPLLGDAAHQEMVECLQRIATDIRSPSAILVISAHWEEREPAITAGPSPSLIYDYYGFPEASYHITYPCPGEPALAKSIHQQLNLANIANHLDDNRGFDHGLFVPLKIMFPDANIPCVQLSLKQSMNPAEHIQMGQALQSLDYDNLLVIGSGFSFHNMKAFFTPETPNSKLQNEAFETWLLDTCTNPALSEENRTQQLTRWAEAPGARFCHPREEHLLPLHVCYGLANRCSTKAFELRVLDKQCSMYLWA